VGTSRGKQGGEGEVRERVNEKGQKKKFGGIRKMSCSKRRESEGNKNRDKKILIVKLKILNKKWEIKPTITTKRTISSVKVLDLFLWCPIQVLALMTGGFLVSLFLLKVGILGCVRKGVSPLVGQLRGEMGGGGFGTVFIGLKGHLLQVGALKWFHHRAGLRAVVGSFCPQDRL
jgi:hypothetical protein